ncbi:MAG: dTDP-4-dehydrorhamnose 3,5-epimerase [Chlamydiota bacterium]|jgi:dTDP-4-dehydrorhamnose 3,5-epimerase
MIVEEGMLEGLKIIQPKKFEDSRGFFMESYQKPRYITQGISSQFVQDNFVFSQKDTLRGMHFQSSPGQDKLITVLKGKIFDVVVDIRPSSPTFKQYYCLTLDDKEHKQFFIPHGFAHGYAALEDSYVLYKVSSIFEAKTEKGFRFDDIAIPWPVENPIVSARDQNSFHFDELDFKKWFP